MTKAPLFPIWQVDEQEYEAVCSYLTISPKPHLYEKLNNYLVNAPFVFQRPSGFSLFLARPRLTRFRIARLDLASKLLFPNHPIRHILNGVIALHECDGEGYTQLSVVPAGWMLVPSLLGWGVGLFTSFLLTLCWVCWQSVLYLTGISFNAHADLTGKQILITGVNRGLGFDLLRHALEQGARVIGTVRNPETSAGLLARLPDAAPLQVIAADLSEPGALTHSLQENRIAADAVDIAVLCAGIKYSDTSVRSTTCLRDTFEVNLFSGIDLADWLFGSDRESTLVLVSSMGRWHGMYSSGGYNASKAALSIWGESLEMELKLDGRKDCKVLIVEPGIFQSGMVQAHGLSRLMSASRSELANHILSCALHGKKTLRYPLWFTLLTWSMCIAGRGLRQRLFARVRK